MPRPIRCCCCCCCCCPGPPCCPAYPAPTTGTLLVPVPVRSRMRRPSINPRRPLFCSPMTLLSSPFHTGLRSRSFSPPPSELLHSDPLTLPEADSSPLDGRFGCTLVLICRDSLWLSPSEMKDPFAVVPAKEKSEADVGEPIGSRLPTKKLGFKEPSIPRPPPAAIAVALNTAAAFL